MVAPLPDGARGKGHLWTWRTESSRFLGGVVGFWERNMAVRSLPYLVCFFLVRSFEQLVFRNDETVASFLCSVHSTGDDAQSYWDGLDPDEWYAWYLRQARNYKFRAPP